MNKVVIQNAKLDANYTKITLDNGLTVLLYPDNRYSTAYALFGTKYGSIDYKFRLEGEKDYLEVPAGIAHFLEHKLFESEELDAFERFAGTGASANAYTSFDKTCYLFSAAVNVNESFEILLDFVSSPYFTQQTVEKEQGIIGQEITMYDDNPGWQLFFRLLSAMYKNHPVAIDIAGTKESISKIDAKLLHKCYDTFYNPANMVVSIAGNFEMEKILKLIDERIGESLGRKVDSFIPQEPAEVVKPLVEANFPVSTNLFEIGFKGEAKGGRDQLSDAVYSGVALELMFGEGSSLFSSLYDSGLINSTLDTEVFSGRGYFAQLVGGESRDPGVVRKLIHDEIAKYKKGDISGQDFDRAKKVMYGQMTAGFNSVEAIANGMINSHFNGYHLFDNIDILRDITLDKFKKFIKESFNKERSSMSVIRPLQNKEA